MTNPELSAHQDEQDRQDQLEDDRLRPIYQAQREALQGFADWLNAQHPSECPYTVMPRDRDMKPYLDGIAIMIECRKESTELDFGLTDDAYLILHALYQKSLT